MTKTEDHAPKTRFAEFRIYEELNDFLPAEQRKVSFRSPFFGTPSVKDVIQAIGVPHTAVDLVLVDGRSVGFGHRLRGGERVAVYPVFERLDISPVVRLRPRPLRETRFIADSHLGKLARHLRMLGFDTAYDRGRNDTALIDLSLQQKRIILTRSVEALKNSRVTHGYWLRHHEALEQLREVMRALDLFSQVQPFTRCMDCNGHIENTDKAGVKGQIDPEIFQRFEEFSQCRGCGKIYWHGTHYERMLRLIRSIVQKNNGLE